MQDGQAAVPIRIYQSDNLILLAAPMPGLEPQNIRISIDGRRVIIDGKERGPRQHDIDLLMAEWTFGPYYREVDLPQAVNGKLSNATYGNGVLCLSMPKADGRQIDGRAEFQLQPIAATRGERVGHTGRSIEPATSRDHCSRAGHGCSER